MVILMIWKLVWKRVLKPIWERVLNLMKTCFEAGYRVNYNVYNRSSGSPESPGPSQGHTYMTQGFQGRPRVIHTWPRALRAIRVSSGHLGQTTFPEPVCKPPMYEKRKKTFYKSMCILHFHFVNSCIQLNNISIQRQSLINAYNDICYLTNIDFYERNRKRRQC